MYRKCSNTLSRIVINQLIFFLLKKIVYLHIIKNKF